MDTTGVSKCVISLCETAKKGALNRMESSFSTEMHQITFYNVTNNSFFFTSNIILIRVLCMADLDTKKNKLLIHAIVELFNKFKKDLF